MCGWLSEAVYMYIRGSNSDLVNRCVCVCVCIREVSVVCVCKPALVFYAISAFLKK
jgi:hypothetical protein